MDNLRKRFLSEHLKREKEYWLQKLSGDLAPCGPPQDFARPEAFAGRDRAVALEFDAESVGRLLRAAGRSESLVFAVLVTALKICLHKYSGLEEVVVGTAIHERRGQDASLNKVLALRDRVSPSASVNELLQDVNRTLHEAYLHQKFPFESLLGLLGVRPAENRAPLFDVAVLLEGVNNPEHLRDLKHDLAVVLSVNADRIGGSVEYNAGLFTPETVRAFAAHYAAVLRAVLQDPGRRVSQVEMSSEEERRQILFDFNDTARDYPGHRTVHELFEEQAARTPDAVALVCGERALSYREVNERANRLAHRLRELGVGADSLVGVCVERGAEMIVALVGVLKAGGAYVPLDPSYPAERLSFMLEDTGARVLVTRREMAGRLPTEGAKVVFVDESSEELGRQPASDPPNVSRPGHLAYVSYTSGSTGRPKGVCVPHRAVVRLVKGADFAEFSADETFLQMAPLAFDASTFEIWGSLLNGARLVLMPPQPASPAELAEALKSHGVTTLWLTAGLFHLMVDERPESLTSLRQLLAGGDVLSVPHVQKFLRAAEAARLVNGYGPTENTTFTCCHTMRRGEEFAGSVPIGRPIANTRVYILDERMRPAPLGVAGELYAGGDGLARGYLGRPALTAERFVPDPFSTEHGARLYRTGDLARYRAGGRIEFLGRRDSQLKVRGFRIEPGEVEAALARCPGVSACAVVARPGADGEKQLVAYVVPDSAAAPSVATWQRQLKETLPDYMVPSAFALLDALPLNANGKVDRAALPAPESAGLGAERPHVEPRTEAEALVAGIWKDLLGAESVGVYDDFFEIGGHSLLASRVMMRVQEAFGVRVPLVAMFESPTVASLTRAVTEAAKGDAPDLPPVRVPRDESLPLSYGQHRLWFLDRMTPNTALYNVYAAFELKGGADLAALERAVNEVVRRHEILRTTFPSIKGHPLQRIHEARPLALQREDLSTLPEAERRGALLTFVTREALRPFDLEEGPLFRATLIQSGEDDYVLLITMHHIVSDAWSLDVLGRELTQLYRAFSEGAASPLEELAVQYADYAAWQRERLRGPAMESQLSYWRRRLEGAPLLLELPADRPRPPLQSFRGARLDFEMSGGEPGSLLARLRALGNGEGVTLFMTLLSGFAALLSRYTGQPDFLIGTAVSNRDRAELEGLVGFFANTLVLRTDLTGGPTFRELLRRVRETCLGAYAHQEVPFERLVEELEPGRDLSRSPLFQVLFSLRNDATNAGRAAGLTLNPLRVETGTSKFELALYAVESEGGLRGAFEYSTDLFDRETVERMAAHLTTLLDAAASDPDTPAHRLPLLTEAERRLLADFNDTATPYERDRCVHELFERQAERTPDAVALAADGASPTLSYRELDERANRLAHHLRGLGVGRESLVAICMERSFEMVVGTLAILKAGGAYVPLDPSYPTERLSFMLKDTGARVLVTQRRLSERLNAAGLEVVLVDSHGDEIAARSPETPASSATPDNLAYVIYTSGSTGGPKGICVPHRAISRLVRNTNYVEFGEDDRVAHVSNSSFDAATFEIWGALLNGGRLEVIRKEVVIDPPEMARELSRRGVTTMFLTTALFNQIAASDGAAFRGMKQLLVGGEALEPKWVREVLSRGRPRRLLNGYGPTENTTFTTWHQIEEVGEADTSVPIGRPISNTRVYVLDERMQPVPFGVRGELYTGGDGLARGYLGRPALTAERFVPDPFSTEHGARLYRTGDVCRQRQDGSIEFLGRADHQVKLRGFRIELGEIEAALNSHPGVKEAVAVILRDEQSGDKRLAAYVIPRDGGVSPDLLRGHLKERLPEYMVPSAFVTLDALPLTANGKVDRAALPSPESVQSAQEEEEEGRAAARTGIEEMVVGIWAEVLGTEAIGVYDDFFEVGGHSLLATQVMSRVREAFGVDLELRSLFENPTVAGLAAAVAAALRGGERAEAAPVKRANRKKQPLPLSHGQQRLWFLERLTPGSSLYNVPVVYHLRGPLDVEALEKSLGEIIRRHESLRTRIGVVAGHPAQVVEKPKKPRLDVADLSGLDPAERDEELRRLTRGHWQPPFDLEQGPLMRSLLVRLGEREHRLHLTMHHIILDGWSVAVITRELATLYEAYSAGGESPLEELPVQYADYAAWQRERLRGPAMESQLSYWRRRLEGAPLLLELPSDRPRPPLQSFRGAGLPFSLDEELSARLRQLGNGEGVTLFMTLLSGFAALLSRYTGQPDFLIGTPVANRVRPELEGLVGFFANTLVLRADLTGGPTFRELLRRVRETCLGAYAHQEVPFERLVEELEPGRDLSRSPLFQVMFSLEHSTLRELKAADLKVSPSILDTETSKFDLSLGLFDTPRGLRGAFEYNTDLFDRETVERMAAHLTTLLDAAASDPDRPVSQLTLLPEGERRQLLDAFNDTARSYPRDGLMHELFERQAERTPDAAALVGGGASLSYRELNERANRLAHYLRGLGVGAESLVGICAERSPEMVVAMLGVLKAGGAYVPLDPAYPAERLAFMLEDARAGVLLTQSGLAGRFPAGARRVVCMDTLRGEIGRHAEENPAPCAAAGNLAYVIYTSGSTGRPKGVAIQHLSAATFLRWAAEAFTPDQLAGVFASTSICFDLSVFEIFAPLCVGGKVILGENALSLPALPAAGEVTLINTVPSAVAELVRAGGLPPSARTVNLAGEALKDALVREVYAQGSVGQVFNLYGPTEDTVYSTWALVGKGEDDHVTIGRPVANTRAYVVDANLRLVPRGVAGELYIGGDGLARGYLGRPALTAERFVPDPFSTGRGARLYRTGDLARHLPDGRLEYLGRLDHQVKLRGFRIEPEEVAAVLASHPDVREAVAVVREDQPGDSRLVAYVAASRSAAPDRLRDYLREKLPPYMIPSALVTLDALPLTPNGKIDRKALPAPDASRPRLATAFVAPRTRAEEEIAAVWRELLRVERVGASDNFFDLGGHSLLLMQAHTKLQQLFGDALTVLDLFKYPTVGALARFLTREEAEESDAQAQPAPAEAAETRPARRPTAVAVIGMAGRFPGCGSVAELWEKLKGGVECVSFFSDGDLEPLGLGEEVLRDPSYVKAGAVVDGAEMFDAEFFDFTPREAEVTDPQHRLFLECAWEALEGAGYAAGTEGGRVGVFAGAGLGTYLRHLYANPEVTRTANAFQLAIGNDKDFLPTRVSYKLNLRGPSVSVQTACSTSLVAVHMACQSLLNGECETALAGGVSVRTPQKNGYFYQEGGINSPDGHCRAFDARAAGTVPGNGVGVVVLKRLEDALADGDTVHAVILGSAINNDGSDKVGFTAPSVGGQAEVVAAAHLAAGVGADTITYVEAHGTGTPLGDPIELAALAQAFGGRTDRKAPCAVGSLKSNMGHLDAAAGVAGLIKTVLALKHRMIPPSLHYERPNPQAGLDGGPFYVNRLLREWLGDGTPRRAGVSSFGIGGTNAHVVLEEAPAPKDADAPTPAGPVLLPLSAKTRSALDRMTADLAVHLRRHPDLDPRDVAYTLQAGRRAFEHRRVLVCDSLADAAARLEGLDPERVPFGVRGPGHRPVVFMYPGQGTPYVNMGLGLYRSYPAFREQVDACSEALGPHLGFDLRRLLYPPESEREEAARRLSLTANAQPALFVVEYALTRLWADLGVEPAAAIGHSIGEYAAACAAGVFSLADALKLVAARGRLMQEQPSGRMLVVPLPESECLALLDEDLSVAAVNAPAVCVVSGPEAAVAALELRLAARGVEGHRLHTSHAFHSPSMEPAVAPFVELVGKVSLSAPRLPFVSNVTGTWVTPSQATSPAYWGEQMRRAVRFAEGVGELLQDPAALLLEVGPGKGLCGLVAQHPGSAGRTAALSSMRHARGAEPDDAHFLRTLGRLWLEGVRLDWPKLYPGRRPRRVFLPTYPFERKRYLVETARSAPPAATVEPAAAGNGHHTVEPPTPPRAQNGAHAAPNGHAVQNGKRHAAIQQIIAQQLEISERQLEVMSQQLRLLHNGKGGKDDSGRSRRD